MCRLCLTCEISFHVKKCILEFFYNILIKYLIVSGFRFPQNFCNFGKQSRRICKIGCTGQIIWRGSKITSFLSVQCHPVAELKLVIPDIVLGMFPHKFNPRPHAGILYS